MAQSNGRMAFWKKLIGSDDPKAVDYYQEGVELLEARKFHDALTSFRLALKESPGDPIVLQQIAMCYTRIGLTDDAAKTYRHVSIPHLETFLSNAPEEAHARAHVEHARWTLAQLRAGTHESSQEPPL